MKIGITTESIDTSGELRGVPMRVTQLLRHYRRQDTNHEFHLIRYGDDPNPLYEDFNQVYLGTVETPSPVVSKTLGNAIRVPPIINDLDVLHITNPFLYEFPLLYVTGPKSVVTIHDMAYYYKKSRASVTDRPKAWAYQTIWKRSMRSVHKKVDRFMAVSENTKAELSRYLGIDPDRVSVVYNGIDESFGLVDITPDDPELPNGPYLISDKPFPDLFRIFSQLKELGVEHKLVIFSGRNYVDNNFVEELGLKKDVEFLGYVSKDRLVKLYNGADAYLRLVYFDGFGIPSIEAMACGCPPFVANVNAASEVVDDAGVLIDPEDLQGWVDEIYEILTDEVRYTTLRERGLKRAQQFSWQKTAEATLDVYEDVANH
jgi:glycosyltransferase involved in cell wall biosynthesis